MKSYEILQKDLAAEQAKRRDAVKRAAKAEADLVVMSEACGQSAAHIRRVEADAEAAAAKSADKLRKMTDGRDELIAKVDSVAKQRDEWREKMLLTESVHADELKAIRAEMAAAKRAENDALVKLKEANSRLAAYGGAGVE